ncbi:MAG: hypothetical protein AB7Q00_14640 [Phycisphaerales bacterium]
MLEPAYASFPYKHTQNNFEVRATRRDGGFILLLFNAQYAAARMVTRLIGDDDVEWKSTTELVTASGIKIRSPHLEQLVEHTDNGEEAKWDFTIPNSYYLAAFLREERPTHTVSDRHLPAGNEPKQPRAPATPRDPKPDGLVSIQDIAEEMKLDPREARQILRKHAEKPSWGWAWAADKVAGIKKLLKEKRK